MTGNKGNLGAYNLINKFKDNVFQRKDNARFAAKETHRQWKQRDPEGYSESQRTKGKKGAQVAMEMGVSIFGMSEEDKRVSRAKGTKTIVDNKLGMFSDEYRVQHAEEMKKVVRDEETGIIYSSCQEAAKSLGVTSATITNRIKAGKITVLKTGSIRRKMQCQ